MTVVETGVEFACVGFAVVTTAIFVVDVSGVAVLLLLGGAAHAASAARAIEITKIGEKRGIHSPGVNCVDAILPDCGEMAN